MHFNLDEISGANRNKLMHSVVVPRPIALVVTIGIDGVLNAAPFSFFNVVSGDPPIVAFGIGASSRPGGGAKDTAANIQKTGQFVLNMVTEDMAAAMNLTAVDFSSEVDELELAGLVTAKSIRVTPPRILCSPASFECELFQTVSISPDRVVVLGRVIVAHIKDDMMIDPERCYVDAAKLGLIARMHGAGWYARTSDLFQMKRLDIAEFSPRSE